MQGLIWGAVGKALATTPLETWHPSSQEINVLMACMSRKDDVHDKAAARSRPELLRGSLVLRLSRT